MLFLGYGEAGGLLVAPVVLQHLWSNLRRSWCPSLGGVAQGLLTCGDARHKESSGLASSITSRRKRTASVPCSLYSLILFARSVCRVS